MCPQREACDNNRRLSCDLLVNFKVQGSSYAKRMFSSYNIFFICELLLLAQIEYYLSTKSMHTPKM